MPDQLQFTVRPDCDNKRLDRTIRAQVGEHFDPPLSNRKAKEIVERGTVLVDGRRERYASRSVRAGQTVVVEVPESLQRSQKRRRQRVELDADDVLYEDEWLIAVNKPAGLPSQATLDEARDHLVAAVGRLLGERGGAEPYLALQHRLDVDTTGVIVLSKSPEANAGLTDAFRERDAHKTYRALAFRDPHWSGALSKPGATWMVENHLALDESGAEPRQVEVHAGGDYAHTDFRLIGASDTALDVEAQPKTGRTHQIRAHLAQVGTPILGDTTYGGPAAVDGAQVERVMLHALRLELPHPVTGKALVIEAPLPDDFVRLARELGAFT